MTKNRLCETREARHLEPEHLASTVGISREHYLDLEYAEEEWVEELDVISLKRLSAALGVSPRFLIEGSQPGVFSPEQLAVQLRLFIDRSGQSAAHLSDQLGWDLEAFLMDPSCLAEFGVGGLRLLCDALGMDWIAVLDTLEFSSQGS